MLFIPFLDTISREDSQPLSDAPPSDDSESSEPELEKKLILKPVSKLVIQPAAVSPVSVKPPPPTMLPPGFATVKPPPPPIPPQFRDSIEGRTPVARPKIVTSGPIALPSGKSPGTPANTPLAGKRD